jgi:hypothetical protein
MPTTALNLETPYGSSSTSPVGDPLGDRPSGKDGLLAEWWARAAILGVATALAWYTWGHWGDFQVDCGREIYAPTALLSGKLLYRDLWYCYGPLAPYLQALLFRIYGVHLVVLFGLGMALTMGTALLAFEVARRFPLPVPVAAAPSLIFLAEAFHPSIFNFVFPYSYSASLGSFLGVACLYLVIRHAGGGRRWNLGLAAVLAGLAALTKQEFGIACIGLLGCEIIAVHLARRSGRETIGNALACVAGLLPAVATYAWFIEKISAKTIFIDNWMSTPGTYFMRTFGKHVMAEQGFRLVPSELIESAAIAGLSFAAWFIAATVSVVVAKKMRTGSRTSILLLMGGVIPVAILLKTTWTSQLIVVPLVHAFGHPMLWITGIDEIQARVSQLVEPQGIFLVGAFFLGAAAWRFMKNPLLGWPLQECVLGTYAVLISVRQMMGNASYSGVFFNVPLFLIFIILLVRVLQRAARALEARRRRLLVNSMAGAQALFIFVLMFPDPQRLPAPLTTNIGTFYTRRDVAEVFPQIVSFLKTHTRNGRDILILPEAPSLYVFAGMQAPSRWYELTPGLLAPEHEQEFIGEIKASGVRFVLISNRGATEYGVAPFGIGYNQPVYQWLMENYVKVSQFGPLTPQGEAYKMVVFEKKGGAVRR